MMRSPKVSKLETRQSDGVSSGPKASRFETQEERCVSSESQVEGQEEQEFPLPRGGSAFLFYLGLSGLAGATHVKEGSQLHPVCFLKY